MAKVEKKVEKSVAQRQPKIEKKPDKSVAQKSVAQRQPKIEKKPDKSVAHRQPNAIQRYFKETVGELRKVNWPSRKEATNLTIVVLIVTFSMSAFLGLLDFIFSRFFALILS